jgi:hypothetical protein
MSKIEKKKDPAIKKKKKGISKTKYLNQRTDKTADPNSRHYVENNRNPSIATKKTYLSTSITNANKSKTIKTFSLQFLVQTNCNHDLYTAINEI